MTDRMGLFEKALAKVNQGYKSVVEFFKRPFAFALITSLCLVIWDCVFRKLGFSPVDYLGANVSFMWQMLSQGFVIPFITFGATILALGVPLAYGTLKDISDKYGSYPVRKKFAHNIVVKLMPVLLLLVIVWGIAILAFPSTSNSFFSKIFLLGYLVLFVLICFAVLSLLKLTRLHSLGSKDLLEQYISEATVSLRKVKNNSVRFKMDFYNRFQETMIGIGDLLAWEAGNTFDPDAASSGLNNYLEIFSSLIEILDRDPRMFMDLSLPKNKHKEIQEKWMNKKNANEINWQIALEDLMNIPDFLPVIILSQIGRVYYSSLHYKQEIYRKRQLTVEIISVLSKFMLKQAAQQGRAPLLNFVFYRMNQMCKESINAGKGVLGVEVLRLVIPIFLFPQLRQEATNTERFYRPLAIRWFRETLFLVASEGDIKTSQQLFGVIFDNVSIGVAANFRDNSSLWDLKLSLKKPFGDLANEFNVLEERGKWLVTVKELETWEGRLESAWESPELYDIERADQSKKQEVLRSAFANLAFNTLLLLIMELGAYCLFKKRFDLIRELWEYKQPSDANGTWCGYDLVPSSADEILGLFWRLSDDTDRYDPPIEGHHGLSQYFDRYIVLLLARSLADKMQGKGFSGGNISLSLKCFKPSELTSAQLYLEKLVKVSKNFLEEKDLLDALGFPKEGRNFLFGRKVPNEVEKFRERCQKQVDRNISERKISDEKVKMFANDFLHAFEEHVIVRKIFQEHGVLKNLTTCDETAVEETFGLIQLDDKEMFLEESTVDYSSSPDWYAEGVAAGEDAELLRWLKDHSEKTIFAQKSFPLEAIMKTLEKFEDLSNVYIFSSVDWSALLDKPGFYEGCNIIVSEEPHYPHYIDGFVLFRDHKIPCVVPNSNHMPDRETCLIVDMKRAGTLRLLYPIAKTWGGNTSSPGQNDGFFFDIRALSDFPELLNQLLDEPPDWLQEKGSKANQEAYLKTKIRIVIQEKFDLKFEAEEKLQPGIYCLSLSSFSQEKSEDE